MTHILIASPMGGDENLMIRNLINNAPIDPMNVAIHVAVVVSCVILIAALATFAMIRLDKAFPLHVPL